MPATSFYNPTTSRTRTIPSWFGPVLAVPIKRGNPISLFNPFLRQSPQRPGPVFPSSTSLRAAIRSSLTMLFSTRPGERLFLPDYGLNLELLIFDVLDSESAAQASARIRAQIERYETRVRVINVEAIREPADPNKLSFQISMQILGEKPNDLLTYSTASVPVA